MFEIIAFCEHAVITLLWMCWRLSDLRDMFWDCVISGNSVGEHWVGDRHVGERNGAEPCANIAIQLHWADSCIFLNLNVECVSLRTLMAEVQYYYFRSSCKALIYHLYLHVADPFLLLPAQWEGVALQHVSWNVVSSVVHEGSLARLCIISCLFQIRRFIIHTSEHWQFL